MEKIALICVSYKTIGQAKKFIAEVISKSSDYHLDIYLADNSPQSTDSSNLGDFEGRSQIHYVPFSQNPGYFGAAELIRQRPDFSENKYEWVMIANVDMNFCDDLFFKKLVTFKDLENLGVIGPSIISELSHNDTNPLIAVRPSTTKMWLYKQIFSTYMTSQGYNFLSILKSSLKKVLKLKRLSVGSTQQIYAPQGSFLIFSRNFFAKGGTFKHGVFLYGEEITVAEFCRNNNLSILHVPEIKVIHHERGSTGFFYSRQVIRWKNESNRYLYEEYFGDRRKSR